MCLLRLRYTSFCLYCDKYFCLWTFIRQVNPSVAPAAVLEGETELLVLDTNVKSTQTDRKRATTVRLYLMFSLWHPQHATPQRFDVFSSSVYVLREDNRNHFCGHDQSSRTKGSIHTAGIIPKWRLLPSCHPRPAGVWEVQSSSSSQLQLHPPSHSWPQGAFGRSLSVYVSTHSCPWTSLSLWGLLYRRRPVGSDASQTEFQRKEGIERRFMLLTPGRSARLNELNWQCDKEPITS